MVLINWTHQPSIKNMTNKAVRFTNFSNEDFTGKWDGQDWPIAKGETVLIQSFLAEHFAKHLIDREMTKVGISTGNEEAREKYMNKCVGNIVLEAESAVKLETKMLNEQPIETKEEDMKPVVEVEKEKALEDMSKTELIKKMKEVGVKAPTMITDRSKMIDAILALQNSEEDSFEGK